MTRAASAGVTNLQGSVQVQETCDALHLLLLLTGVLLLQDLLQGPFLTLLLQYHERNHVGLRPIMAVGVLYLEEGDLQAREQGLKRELEASRLANQKGSQEKLLVA